MAYSHRRIMAVCTLWLIIAGARAAEPTPVVGPHLVVDPAVVDAGDVVRGQVATAVFQIRNTGTQTLTILDARPGCGCTVASFDKTVEPGKTGKVTAQVKTETFRGPIEKTISVTSNDASAPTLTLRVKANVVGSVEIFPAGYLAFPRPPLLGYTAKLLIRKEKTETGKLDLSDVTASVPWVTVKSRKVKSPEPESEGVPAALPGDWMLDVTVAEDAPSQTGGQQLQFHTGLGREPQVTIPLSISFIQSIAADPASLVMYIKEGMTEASTSFNVALRPGLAAETVTATGTPGSFAVTLQQDGQRRYKADVNWKAAGETGDRFGSLVVIAGKESLTVPVRVVYRAANARPLPGAPGSPAAVKSAVTEGATSAVTP